MGRAEIPVADLDFGCPDCSECDTAEHMVFDRRWTCTRCGAVWTSNGKHGHRPATLAEILAPVSDSRASP